MDIHSLNLATDSYNKMLLDKYLNDRADDEDDDGEGVSEEIKEEAKKREVS